MKNDNMIEDILKRRGFTTGVYKYVWTRDHWIVRIIDNEIECFSDTDKSKISAYLHSNMEEMTEERMESVINSMDEFDNK